MNRSRTLMRNCACRCASKSGKFAKSDLARPRSTSPMTSWRRSPWPTGWWFLNGGPDRADRHPDGCLSAPGDHLCGRLIGSPAMKHAVCRLSALAGVKRTGSRICRLARDLIGLRPEDLSLAPAAEDEISPQRAVDVLEPAGPGKSSASEFHGDQGTGLSRVCPHVPDVSGRVLHLTFQHQKRDKLHPFDQATGKRVAMTSNPFRRLHGAPIIYGSSRRARCSARKTRWQAFVTCVKLVRKGLKSTCRYAAGTSASARVVHRPVFVSQCGLRAGPRRGPMANRTEGPKILVDLSLAQLQSSLGCGSSEPPRSR